MLACEYGHTDIVKLLLAVPDIDINMKDEVRKNDDIVANLTHRVYKYFLTNCFV